MTEKRPELSAESTLTDRYQTTIPAMVRKALGLGKQDKLQFLLDETGAVRIKKAEEPKEHFDPALVGFLDLLANDIVQNPQNLREIDESYFDRMQKILDEMPALPPYDPEEKLDFEPGENDYWLYPDSSK